MPIMAATPSTYRRPVTRGAIAGAAIAGIISGWLLLLPALASPSRLAIVAVLIAMAGGAGAGAAVASLYKVLGRVRLWTIVLVLSLASLAYVASATDIRTDGTLLIEAGLCAASALSLWVLLAYGLHVARKSRRDPRRERSRR